MSECAVHGPAAAFRKEYILRVKELTDIDIVFEFIHSSGVFPGFKSLR